MAGRALLTAVMLTRGVGVDPLAPRLSLVPGHVTKRIIPIAGGMVLV